MPTLYTKNEAGELVEVDEAELVKNSDAYKSVLTESIERRKRIKALEDEKAAGAQSEGTPDPQKPATAEPQVQAPAPVVIDPAKIAEEAANAAYERISKEQQEARNRKSQIEAIIADNNLPDSVYDVLAAMPTIEQAQTQAKTLVKAGLRFESTPTGGNGVSVDPKRLSKLDEQLGLSDLLKDR